ncbi:MAG: DUF2292 domain-containing protein [Candidatus Omnitrophota bacterium]|jgi:hypothetical protein|nr:MAG: DUF2292 domain-containing protein [Candidatus Omnitrophota bacterium]
MMETTEKRAPTALHRLPLYLSLDQLERLANALREITDSGYGEITLVIANGQVDRIKETKSYR